MRVLRHGNDVGVLTLTINRADAGNAIPYYVRDRLIELCEAHGEIEKATPQLQFTEEVLPLVIPDHTIGETEGVSMNSKGHLFVYSRTGTGGSSRGGTAAQLYDFISRQMPSIRSAT